ncbi:formate dehydrogenase accessory protein FdhE [Robertmurraya massiliosenegalensis]|uniref:formate dehydrogenase accessory protein FdhE n=1 Tax=Robertmurraya TaxID=2837507 RepID=UPI0039A58B28
MNVLNKDYQQLQEQIQQLSDKWNQQLQEDILTDSEQIKTITQYPALSQLKLSVDLDQYHRFIEELLHLLRDTQPSLDSDIQTLLTTITTEVLGQWFPEALTVNQDFFEKFAENHHVANWLPYFVAEHAIRPYLQKAAAEVKEELKNVDVSGGCPACGEAPRLAIINKKGKKEVTCPRCQFAWEVKKIKCAHCGSEEPGKLEILKVEKDDSAEVHVCHECKGYTKVIDVRKKIKKESIALLDIKSIHLDFIAQENGYGVSEHSDVN